MFNYVAFYFFIFFQAKSFFIHFTLANFLKNESLLYSLRKVFENTIFRVNQGILSDTETMIKLKFKSVF